MKTTYLVATVARYVLVDAESEAQARELGQPALEELCADLVERFGDAAAVRIHTVREATPEEIALWIWHQSKLKAEARRCQ